MTDSLSTTSLRDAFKFPFQSHDGPGRFLVGAALLFASLFVPIIPALFVYGYVVEVMRQVIKGEPPALPEWKNWGQLAVDGLRSLVIGVVYTAPGWIVMIGGWVAYMVMYFWGIALISKTPARHAPPDAAFPLIFGAMGILFLSLLVGWLLCLAGVIPLPAALAHFVARDKLSAAFHLREWGAVVRADKWGYFIGWVVVVGLMGVMYCVMMLFYFTVVLCCLMYFVAIPIGFYLLLVSAAVFGQLYRESAAKANLPVDVKETPAAPAL